MPRRVTLTDRQREALLHLPVDQGELLRHYTLSDEDLGHIRQRRRASKPELVAGFSLLYEDNTIQHIGMEFPRSSLMGDMYIADHPMKGLPFDFYEGETVRKAQAVTAAQGRVEASR